MWTKARRGYARFFHAQSPARGKFWISKSLGTSVVVHTNKEKYGVAIDPILFWKSQAVVVSSVSEERRLRRLLRGAVGPNHCGPSSLSSTIRSCPST
jgi:hypothetical protein